MNSTANLSSLIWSSADDVLRGLFKPSEYGRVILPLAVMRRLDCVLKPQKDKSYGLCESYKNKLSDPFPVILKQVKLPFFNHSKYDLTRIKSELNNVLMNFNNYIQGYSPNVLMDERFDFCKKVGENQSIRDMICRMLYSGYQQDRPLMVLGDSE